MKRSPQGDAPLLERLTASFLLIGEVAPIAPATFASLAILPFMPPFVAAALWVQLIVVAVTVFVGTVASHRAERFYGHDGSAIVIDEVAGMWITFIGVTLPADWWTRLAVLLVGFLFFRVFDIVKPPPANRAQNLRGGIGVMADDLIAGIYANLALRVIMRVAGWN